MVIKLKNVSNTIAVFLKKDYTSVSVKPGEYVLIEESFILRKPSVLIIEKINESKKSKESEKVEIEVKEEKVETEEVKEEKVETEEVKEEKVEEKTKEKVKQKRTRRNSKKDKND